MTTEIFLSFFVIMSQENAHYTQLEDSAKQGFFNAAAIYLCENIAASDVEVHLHILTYQLRHAASFEDKVARINEFVREALSHPAMSPTLSYETMSPEMFYQVMYPELFYQAIAPEMLIKFLEMMGKERITYGHLMPDVNRLIIQALSRSLLNNKSSFTQISAFLNQTYYLGHAWLDFVSHGIDVPIMQKFQHYLFGRDFLNELPTALLTFDKLGLMWFNLVGYSVAKRISLKVNESLNLYSLSELSMIILSLSRMGCPDTLLLQSLAERVVTQMSFDSARSNEIILQRLWQAYFFLKHTTHVSNETCSKLIKAINQQNWRGTAPTDSHLQSDVVRLLREVVSTRETAMEVREEECIGPFHVDIYLPEWHTAIEVNGHHHFDSCGRRRSIDIKRTTLLGVMGCKVQYIDYKIWNACDTEDKKKKFLQQLLRLIEKASTHSPCVHLAKSILQEPQSNTTSMLGVEAKPFVPKMKT